MNLRHVLSTTRQDFGRGTSHSAIGISPSLVELYQSLLFERAADPFHSFHFQAEALWLFDRSETLPLYDHSSLGQSIQELGSRKSQVLTEDHSAGEKHIIMQLPIVHSSALG